MNLPDTLYKYYNCKSIVDEDYDLTKLWFSKPSNLNDIFEGFHIPLDEYKKVDSKLYEKSIRPFLNNTDLLPSIDIISTAIEKTFFEHRKIVRIFCLSETPLSNPMWAHYSDNHSGICLAYSTEGIKKSVNNYSPTIEKINYTEKNILKAFLNNLADHHDIVKAFNSLYFYKSSNWQYEKEWRVLITDKNETEKIMNNFKKRLKNQSQTKKVESNIEIISRFTHNFPKYLKAVLLGRKFSYNDKNTLYTYKNLYDLKTKKTDTEYFLQAIQEKPLMPSNCETQQKLNERLHNWILEEIKKNDNNNELISYLLSFFKKSLNNIKMKIKDTTEFFNDIKDIFENPIEALDKLSTTQKKKILKNILETLNEQIKLCQSHLTKQRIKRTLINTASKIEPSQLEQILKNRAEALKPYALSEASVFLDSFEEFLNQTNKNVEVITTPYLTDLASSIKQISHFKQISLEITKPTKNKNSGFKWDIHNLFESWFIGIDINYNSNEFHQTVLTPLKKL